MTHIEKAREYMETVDAMDAKQEGYPEAVKPQTQELVLRAIAHTLIDLADTVDQLRRHGIYRQER